ncbi:MAG: TetR/AcrR family transcriptional regulator, partial [Thermodesulfobacteriota bacterium]|nr:TetR/AcrR family transcriptional regulator [Thermodesulfobacteriota bacterium]
MGIAERKERERSQRSEQIRNAAKGVFLGKGFNGATIEEIANKAELSSGTIYLYYKNKDELFASLILHSLESLNLRLGDILSKKKLPADQKLDQAWKALFRVFSSDPIAVRVIFHFQLEDALQLLSPPLLSSLNEVSKKIINRIALIFQAGIDEGIYKELNPMALADILMSLFMGLIVWEDAKR